MSQTTVTMQLNATDVAGDWATRSVAKARRTTTGIHARRSDELAVYMSELRGAVEAMKQGAHSPNIADSRTDNAQLGWGTPALYQGMRFAIDCA